MTTLKTIIFDWRNYNWTKDQEINEMFIKCTENHINGIISHRGYIYLNQICEALGVEWNPDDDNPCIKRGEVDTVQLQCKKRMFVNDSFMICVTTNDF
jgi:hypothetical protein